MVYNVTLSFQTRKFSRTDVWLVALSSVYSSPSAKCIDTESSSQPKKLRYITIYQNWLMKLHLYEGSAESVYKV